MSYCTYCLSLPEDNHHRIYHDNHYGHPLFDDDQLFERLILEINQAGLSWDIILKKQGSFRAAFDNFSIKKVAHYGDAEIERLLQDPGIIRNKLKVNAAIHNAQVIVNLQKEHGSFKQWLLSQHPLSKIEWMKIFKKTFKFTGGEIVNEFLQSTGFLPTPHDADCPVFLHVEALKKKHGLS